MNGPMNFWTRAEPELTELPDTGFGPVTVRRNPRARRITMRVSQLDGRVTITAPKRTPSAELQAFLADHQEWLDRAVGRVLPQIPVTGGAEIMLRGTPCQVIHDPSRRLGARQEGDDVLTVGGRPDQVGTRIAAFLKEAARAELARQVPELAHDIQRRAGKLTLRDTRSRWGSCTTNGDLMFSWRLIMAPPEVLRYVAAHEVAHLRHMDHSAAFWATVEELMPDYKAPRKWLKDHGRSLHRYVFQ